MSWWVYLIAFVIALIVWDFRRFSKKRDAEANAEAVQQDRQRQFGRRITPASLPEQRNQQESDSAGRDIPTNAGNYPTEMRERPEWFGTDRFEREVIALIEASQLERAETVTVEAIEQFGSPRLIEVSQSTEELAIQGWEELFADLIAADDFLQQQYGAPAAAVSIRLVNRDNSDRLTLKRWFHASAGDDSKPLVEHDDVTWAPPPEHEKPIQILGFDDLIAIQRSSLPTSATMDAVRNQMIVDNSLAGLLLLVRYHQLVERHLQSVGLPRRVLAYVGVDLTPWPMEQGVYDYSRQALRKSVSTESRLAQNRAKELLAARKEEILAEFQHEQSEYIAQLREIYRLAHFFPFYRTNGAKKLGEQLTGQLKAICSARGISSEGVSWRMSKRAFEQLIRKFAETRGLPSAEDALDTAHVDRLHEEWLNIARERNFNLSDTPVTLFELQLAWALKFGGPIVQDRWERAKPYSIS